MHKTHTHTHLLRITPSNWTRFSFFCVKNGFVSLHSVHNLEYFLYKQWFSRQLKQRIAFRVVFAECMHRFAHRIDFMVNTRLPECEWARAFFYVNRFDCLERARVGCRCLFKTLFDSIQAIAKQRRKRINSLHSLTIGFMCANSRNFAAKKKHTREETLKCIVQQFCRFNSMCFIVCVCFFFHGYCWLLTFTNIVEFYLQCTVYSVQYTHSVHWTHRDTFSVFIVYFCAGPIKSYLVHCSHVTIHKDIQKRNKIFVCDTVNKRKDLYISKVYTPPKPLQKRTWQKHSKYERLLLSVQMPMCVRVCLWQWSVFVLSIGW